MSKKASTHLIVLEPLEDLIASEPWSVETYAEGLMDELFTDIDQILDGSNLPSQRLQQARPSGNQYTVRASEYAPLQTVTTPQIVLPETLIQQPVQNPQARNKQFNTVLVDTPTRKRVSKRRKLWRTIGRLLSSGVSLGVIVAAIVWVVNSGVLNRIGTNSFQLSQPQPQPQSLPTRTQVEADFVDYMLGALAAIDRQETSNQKSAKTIFSVASANQTALAYIHQPSRGKLPPPLAANNKPPAPSNSTKVVERIYIPVYQAPSPMRYAPPPILIAHKPSPTVALAQHKTTNNAASKPKDNASKPKAVKTALKTVPKPAKPVNVKVVAVRPEPKLVALQTAPVTVKQTLKPLSASPVVPRVTPSKSPAATPTPSPAEAATPIPSRADQQVVAIVSAPTPTAPSRVLEGLLELGDKSAALFKIDGVSQRVIVGENIGASGWTLVDVSKGEAVIRRNGEVRSIYTGQKF